MDGWLILGFFMIVVGLPVILGIGSEIYKRRLQFQERKLELLGGESAAQAARQAELIERLERRVRVLEQIATDRGAETAAQIEALRGPRPIERERIGNG